jgi:hypothetical protein
MCGDNGGGPALLARAKELEADLLGMVGCGRGGMCARNFGGGTPHVLDHRNGSLLIAR